MKTLLATTAIALSFVAGTASAGPVLDGALAKIDLAYEKFDSAVVPADVINSIKELVYHVENHNAVNNIDFSALTQDETTGLYTLPAIMVDKYDFTNEIATHTAAVVAHINDDMFGTAGVNPSNDFADIKLIAPAVAGADWSVEGSGLVADKLNAEILVDLNKIQDGLDTFDYSAASLKAVLDGVDELSANVDTFNVAVEALNASEADVIGSTGTDYAHAVRTNAFDVATDENNEMYRSEVTRASTDSVVDSFVN